MTRDELLQLIAEVQQVQSELDDVKRASLKPKGLRLRRQMRRRF